MPPLTLLLGEWRPDTAEVDTGFLREARNVLPTAVGYGPFPEFAIYDPTNATALPAQCLGAWYARTLQGGWVLYAATQTNIYRFVGGAWVSKGSGFSGPPAGEFWRARQYGSRMIFVNRADNPVYVDVDLDTSTSLLGGSPPLATNIEVVGEFVVLTLANEWAVQWSGANNSDQWTIGTNLSDKQVFPDLGRVLAVLVIGDGIALIAQEQGWRQMVFTAGATIFKFDVIEGAKGCISPYSAVSVGGDTYYEAENGFYSIGQRGLQPIGYQRVNDWFRENRDAAQYFTTTAFFDPSSPRVVWAFRTSATTTSFDRALIYDFQLNRFSYVTADMEMWGQLAAPAVTLEQLDALFPSGIDAMNVSFDARQFEGGRPVLAGIQSGTRKFGFFDSMTVSDLELTTCDFRHLAGMRALIDEIETDSASDVPVVSVSGREKMSAGVTFVAFTQSTNTGVYHGRKSGRVHRYKVTAASWFDHIGRLTLAQPQPDGLR